MLGSRLLIAWLGCIEGLACGSGAHRLMAKHHVNPKRCSPNNLFDGLVRKTHSHGCAQALAIGTQFARRKTIAALQFVSSCTIAVQKKLAGKPQTLIARQTPQATLLVAQHIYG